MHLRDLEGTDERAEEPVDGGRTFTVRRIELPPVAMHQDDVGGEQQDLDVPAEQGLEVRRPEQDHAGDDHARTRGAEPTRTRPR